MYHDVSNNNVSPTMCQSFIAVVAEAENFDTGACCCAPNCQFTIIIVVAIAIFIVFAIADVKMCTKWLWGSNIRFEQYEANAKFQPLF